MAGTLTVQTLQGPSSGANANKVLIPSGQTLDVSGGTLVPSAGQVVNCKSYTDGTYIKISPSSFVTVYTFPTYTPVLSNSTVVFKFNILSRGWENSGPDARGKLRFYVDGSLVIDDQEYGTYDYGNSGSWNRNTYANGYPHQNTDGSPISSYIQLASKGNNIEYNDVGGVSTTRSYYEIMEIAQ